MKLNDYVVMLLEQFIKDYQSKQPKKNKKK
jgi:hypothetical protein